MRLHDYQIKLPVDNKIVDNIAKNNSVAYAINYKKSQLKDPVDAYLFVKDELLKEKTLHTALKDEYSALTQLRKLENIAPIEEEDTINVVKQIFNLQATYHVSVTFFTDGFVGPNYCLRPLRTYSIYQIAMVACGLKRHYHCIDWMNFADVKNNIDWDPRVLREKQLEAIGLSLMIQGNMKRTWLVSLELSRRWPKKEFAKKNVAQLKRFLKPEEMKTIDYVPPLVNRLSPDSNLNKLCRDEVPFTFYQNSSAVCYYQQNGYLNYFKVELLNLDPYVRLFHNVAGPSTTRRLRELASDKLVRGLVMDPKTGTKKTTSLRLSLTADLKKSDDENVKNTDKMIGRMTELDMEAAESLKVIQYGVGGVYQPHYDFEPDKKANAVLGNRIATTLLYLNTPYKGGATVFTHLKLHVPAIEGNALVWYNTHEDGTGDMRTQHAGCSILSGEKWIANKWIFYDGQRLQCRV
ncbi:unnamed protein product [Bursaphelenchus okinawaensis]|uniref:Fe2OG dioxygenase domain-containing protein n=1 Tax=Bursaphelenchus okinawaensis TaxID=465554 RepID=A0A811KW22_9BILA|nr:unnamed protein product [Bursaphelenchus okinawaensis]CAG9112852.1 unnamed protein product [Bursaphelenchus okinawaensis]